MNSFEMKNHNEIAVHDTSNRYRIVMFNGDELYDYGKSRDDVMSKVTEHRKLQNKEHRILMVEKVKK